MFWSSPLWCLPQRRFYCRDDCRCPVASVPCTRDGTSAAVSTAGSGGRRVKEMPLPPRPTMPQLSTTILPALPNSWSPGRYGIALLGRFHQNEEAVPELILVETSEGASPSPHLGTPTSAPTSKHLEYHVSQQSLSVWGSRRLRFEDRYPIDGPFNSAVTSAELPLIDIKPTIAYKISEALIRRGERRYLHICKLSGRRTCGTETDERRSLGNPSWSVNRTEWERDRGGSDGQRAVYAHEK